MKDGLLVLLLWVCGMLFTGGIIIAITAAWQYGSLPVWAPTFPEFFLFKSLSFHPALLISGGIVSALVGAFGAEVVGDRIGE